MRLAVVSDIHGNLPALQAVVADAGAVDLWLNLGDIVSGPLWPAETADFLMAKHGWLTMAGNHERQVLTLPAARMGASDRFAAQALLPRHRAWLAALPPRLAPVPGLACVHGTPSNDLVYLLHSVEPEGLREASDEEVAARVGNEGAPWLLCGHSHLPRERHGPWGWIVNPGSVGLPAFDDVHPHPHVVETGSPHARYALLEGEPGAWRVSLRAVAYDHEAAAARAEAQGRGDWADALRSGRVGRREADVTA